MIRDPRLSDSALSRQATWGELQVEGAALEEVVSSLRAVLNRRVYYVVVGEVPGTYRSRLPVGLEAHALVEDLSTGDEQGLVSYEWQGERYAAALLQGNSGESFGWLLTESQGLTSAALRALEAGARELGERFEQAWLLRCANYDALTRLPNRRYLDRLLTQGFEESLSLGQPYSVAFVDLDHFKQVNDTHGHDVGDQVLREAADRLSSAIRAGDALGRWGGEEFVIGFANVNADEAKVLGERLSLALGVAPMEAGVWVTASVGIASSPAHADSLGKLLREADAALYEAKAAGRDRVIVSGGGRQEEQSQREEVPTWLTCQDLAAASYPLMPSVRYLVGRSIQCDIRLQDPSVSRIHAAIRMDRDGRIYLADQGSFNGILRNQRPIRRTVELRVGDRVQIGRYVFVVEANSRSLDESQQTTACRRVAVANLAKTKLSEVLASAKRRQLTCSFDIAYSGGRAQIALEDGEVTRVVYGELEGSEALDVLRSLQEGLCVLS